MARAVSATTRPGASQPSPSSLHPLSIAAIGPAPCVGLSDGSSRVRTARSFGAASDVTSPARPGHARCAVHPLPGVRRLRRNNCSVPSARVPATKKVSPSTATLRRNERRGRGGTVATRAFAVNASVLDGFYTATTGALINRKACRPFPATAPTGPRGCHVMRAQALRLSSSTSAASPARRNEAPVDRRARAKRTSTLDTRQRPFGSRRRFSARASCRAATSIASPSANTRLGHGPPLKVADACPFIGTHCPRSPAHARRCAGSRARPGIVIFRNVLCRLDCENAG